MQVLPEVTEMKRVDSLYNQQQQRTNNNKEREVLINTCTIALGMQSYC